MHDPQPDADPGLRWTARRRSLALAGGAIAACAIAIAVIVSVSSPSSSEGASAAPTVAGTTTVQRRDLVATDTESGTLGYTNPQTVYNRLSGTVTSLPAIGQVIAAGQTLYRVDGNPVVLFNGTVPAYRSLSDGVSNGPDVEQLKRNLVALGFDPEHNITINQVFDSATTAAVERWQASLGETETGTVSLGQVVFLSGSQRVTAVDTTLGSTGGSSGSSAASSTSGASYIVPSASSPQFVSLTTTSTAPTSTNTTSSTSSASGSSTPPTPTGTTKTTPPTTSSPTTKTTSTKCKTKSKSGQHRSSSACPPTTAAELLALLKAETQELKKSASTGSTGTKAGASSSGTGGSSQGAGSSSASASGSGTTSSGGSSSGSGSGSSAGASAQATLQTTSNQLVVTVDLDASKQSEAVRGAPVTVQMPSGTTVAGRITHVSSVAQSSSSSGSSSTGGSSGGSGSSSTSSSSTIPVTIKVTGRHAGGLDQAAVSVNFNQQVERNVLSVPVTALLATAGGGYAIQEATAPHRLIPVTPGLFAAGYVQISGPQVYSGLQVTDSQG